VQILGQAGVYFFMIHAANVGIFLMSAIFFYLTVCKVLTNVGTA
jgi:hypothetical protein